LKGFFLYAANSLGPETTYHVKLPIQLSEQISEKLSDRKHCYVMNRVARCAVENVSSPPRTIRTILRGKQLSLDKNNEAERTEMGKSTVC
jgi:hypothetical protein